MQLVDKEKPWDGICCEACWYAREKRCMCKCGGKHHGEGISRKVTDDWKIQSSEAAQLYARLIRKWECPSCGHDLRGEQLVHYDHSSGFPVKGFTENQWIFIVCPICRRQNSLLTLGVPPNATYAAAEAARPIEQQFVREDE